MKEALIIALIVVVSVLLYDYHRSTPVLASSARYARSATPARLAKASTDSADSACFDRCSRRWPNNLDAELACALTCDPNYNPNWFKTR
jgi:hypothetical protein